MEILTFDKVLKDMKNCYQFENVNMYQHGLMVNNEYLMLLLSLEKGVVPEGVPESLIEVYKKNWFNLLDYETMKHYQIYHDIGKPYCRIVNEEGKQQFPNHAQVSYEVYKQLFPHLLIEQDLIKHDMDFHTLKVSDEKVQELIKSEIGFSLYLTAWAEILANCQMFGGIESTSFKIKKKHLSKFIKYF